MSEDGGDLFMKLKPNEGTDGDRESSEKVFLHYFFNKTHKRKLVLDPKLLMLYMSPKVWDFTTQQLQQHITF